MKSVTALDRLFMVDIANAKANAIELVLHFVNKNRDPKQLPTIKRYKM